MKINKNIKILIERHIYKIIFLLFSFYVFYLISELYLLQIIKGSQYNEIVVSKSTKNNSENIKRRGNIFFKNNYNEKVAVALQSYKYTIAFNPSKTKNPKDLYEKVKDILIFDKKDFFRKSEKKEDPYEEIVRGVDEEVVKKLKEKELNLIYIKKSVRKYPFETLASKVLGFTNIDMVGVYGLEKYYENILARKQNNSKENIFELFFNSDEKKDIFSQKIIFKEGDLISSMDIGLNLFLEKTLRKIDKKYQSRYTGAVILKADTGEVVAMTDSNNFDLNSEKKDFRNVFIEHRFEMGSTFKPLVVAIGLESGKISKNFLYNDKGCVNISEKIICNFDKKGRGKNINLQTIISESLNTGMIEIEKKMGHKTFLKYILDLGLSEETGIDLPKEIASTISNLNSKNNINYASASFGQGIAFTPIAIIRALTTIANDGYLITPHIITKIEYGGLIPSREFSSERKKVFSPHTIKVIKDIMVKRADDYAKNKNYFNQNFSVASKTGTAQIASPDGGYYKNKNIHSYFGFFPAYASPEERYSIFIYTIEPKRVKYSSETLTEPFYKIVNFMIGYFDIKPDRPKIKLSD